MQFLIFICVLFLISFLVALFRNLIVFSSPVIKEMAIIKNIGFNNYENYYYMIFECSNNFKTLELRVPKEKFEILKIGDFGVLSHQDKTFVDFNKK